MQNFSRKYLLRILLLVMFTCGVMYPHLPVSAQHVVYVACGIVAFLFGGVFLYGGIALMMQQDVATEAKSKHVSTPKMWGIMVKRSFLYLIVPSFALTVLLLAGTYIYLTLRR